MENRERYSVTRIFRINKGVQATGGADNDDDGHVAFDEKPLLTRTASEEAVAFAKENREKYLVSKIFRKDKAVQATDREYTDEDDYLPSEESPSLSRFASENSFEKEDDGDRNNVLDEDKWTQTNDHYNWGFIYFVSHLCIALLFWSYCILFIFLAGFL